MMMGVISDLRLSPRAVALPRAASPLRFGSVKQDPRGINTRTEGVTQFITLSKPSRKNAYDLDILKALDEAVVEAEKNPKIRTLVFESGMEQYFSAGVDIMPLLQQGLETKKHLDTKLSFLPKAIRNALFTGLQYAKLHTLAMQGLAFHQHLAKSSKVTIAKVNGLAIGGGMETALACDYLIASDKARFTLPETKYGLFPDWGGTERLPQRIGPTMAKFMILEGGLMSDKGAQGPATLTAQEAREIGLVDEVVPASQLDAAVQTAIASAQKRMKPQTRAELETLDIQVYEKLKADQSRLLSRFERYQSADLDDLQANELKSLYQPCLKLALRRIEAAPKFNWLTHQRDLAQMFGHTAKVAQMARKQQ